MAKTTKPSAPGSTGTRRTGGGVKAEANIEEGVAKPKRRPHSKPFEEEDPIPEIVHMGKVVVEARNKKGLTQVEVAQLSGLNVASVFQFENGKQNMTIKNILLLAKALDLELADLVPGRTFTSPAELQRAADALSATAEQMNDQIRAVMRQVQQLLKIPGQ